MIQFTTRLLTTFPAIALMACPAIADEKVKRILALRTGARASQRGLSPAPVKGVWYLASDYPERVSGIAHRLTGGSW